MVSLRIAVYSGGPRFGLAYNWGKNVIRIGGGTFYDRVTTFEIGTTSNYVTNPPTLVQSQILYGNLATIPKSASTVNVPATVTGLSPDGHVPTVYNYSAGIQRELPFQTLLDVFYVGSQSRHLPEQDPFNYVAFGSAWLPKNQDSTLGPPQNNGNTTLPTQLYRPYAGYTSGSYYTFGSSSNYNALQVSANHRVGHGLISLGCPLYLVESAWDSWIVSRHAGTRIHPENPRLQLRTGRFR